MRPLRLAPPLLLLVALARAGTVVEIAPVEVRPGSGSSAVSANPTLQLAPSAVVGLTPLVAPALSAPSAPQLLSPAPVVALQKGAAGLVPAKGEKAGGVTQQGGLRALYDGGSAASKPENDVAGAESNVAPALSPFKPVGKTSKAELPAPVRKASPSRFPLLRGEIGWKEMWRLVNPSSDANTVKWATFKSPKTLDEEAAMHRHNVGYVLGFRERNWQDQSALDRAERRRRELAERSAKVRSYYGLPAFKTLSPPLVGLGEKLGAGGQGTAYRKAGDPSRAIKVFNNADGPQLQEMAAILNAVADQGWPVERVTVVEIAGGGYGLEMRTFDRDGGWMELAMAYRWNAHNQDPKINAATLRAEETLRALGIESKAALGIDAADWKAGFGGSISDDHLENFAYKRETGEIAGFDPLVKW